MASGAITRLHQVHEVRLAPRGVRAGGRDCGAGPFAPRGLAHQPRAVDDRCLEAPRAADEGPAHEEADDLLVVPEIDRRGREGPCGFLGVARQGSVDQDFVGSRRGSFGLGNRREVGRRRRGAGNWRACERDDEAHIRGAGVRALRADPSPPCCCGVDAGDAGSGRSAMEAEV
jgi:hypothetical protein